MTPAKGSSRDRWVFLDNLRWFLVVCIVLQHSSNAYSNLTWWPVAENNPSMIAGWFRAVIDGFAMPLFFYVAGYLAVSTVQKGSTVRFLKGKLRRLGIPWLICILTICPILPLIYHYTRNNLTLSTSYWGLWIDLMKRAAEFDFGIIYSMDGLMQGNGFYQRYMWFLSLLILFFIVFGILYRLKGGWFEPDDRSLTPVDPSISSTLKLLVVVGSMTFLCSFLMIGMMFFLAPGLSNPEPFYSLGNVIQFRPSRIFLFVVYFGMGILTYKRRWIERGRFPGHFVTWVISFIIVLLLFLYARHLMLNGPEHLEELSGIVFFFLLNFLTISSLGLFTSLAIRYWNRPTKAGQSLAANSYSMYLTHYVFVLVFQLVLFNFPGVSGLVKFGLVSGLSIVCSYLVSRLLVTPFPRLAAASAVGLLVLMSLVIHP
jgi:hypothetical protein